MIKKALTKPKTLHELYNLLYHSHTMHSLKIELDFLIQIGSVILENNLYRLKQFSYICKRKLLWSRQLIIIYRIFCKKILDLSDAEFAVFYFKINDMHVGILEMARQIMVANKWIKPRTKLDKSLLEIETGSPVEAVCIIMDIQRGTFYTPNKFNFKKKKNK